MVRVGVCDNLIPIDSQAGFMNFHINLQARYSIAVTQLMVRWYGKGGRRHIVCGLTVGELPF